MCAIWQRDCVGLIEPIVGNLHPIEQVAGVGAQEDKRDGGERLWELVIGQRSGQKHIHTECIERWPDGEVAQRSVDGWLLWGLIHTGVLIENEKATARARMSR